MSEIDSRNVTEAVTNVNGIVTPLFCRHARAFPGIHVLRAVEAEDVDGPGHRRAKRRRPSDGYARL
jgi:hypothetical protein